MDLHQEFAEMGMSAEQIKLSISLRLDKILPNCSLFLIASHGIELRNHLNSIFLFIEGNDVDCRFNVQGELTHSETVTLCEENIDYLTDLIHLQIG